MPLRRNRRTKRTARKNPRVASASTTVPQQKTEYGTARYRSHLLHSSVSKPRGTPQEAIILDIDGTLQGIGQGAQQKVLDWCEVHARKGRAFLVITARDHSYMYDSSFNWLLKNFPHPFIGPFCRAVDDPRYASEFKRELAQGLENAGAFKIVGAADDNEFVNKMWRHWAQTHECDFDLLECEYERYDAWRAGIPAKSSGSSWPSHYATGSGSAANWRNGPAVMPRDDEESRVELYSALGAIFDFRYYDEELDVLSLDQLDQLMLMTPKEADHFVDALVSAHKKSTEREELEAEVYARLPDISVSQIEQMDTEVLRGLAEGVS